MERPSHIDIDTHQSSLQRLPVIALAIGLQIAIAWLFTSGLANHSRIFIDHIIELAPIQPTKLSPVEPPKPVLKTPTKVTADPPIFTVGRDPDEKTITAAPSQPETGPAPTGAGMDRAPIGIASTHTTPPYPVVARRVGAEGKVMLRLTVLADGHVGKADVVSSSGRADLDDAAQAWIMAHWAYRPALDNGVAVISHATAIVTFNLENAR